MLNTDTVAAIAGASNAELQRELLARALARHGREIERLERQLSTMHTKQLSRESEYLRLEATIAAANKI